MKARLTVLDVKSQTAEMAARLMEARRRCDRLSAPGTAQHELLWKGALDIATKRAGKVWVMLGLTHLMVEDDLREIDAPWALRECRVYVRRLHAVSP